MRLRCMISRSLVRVIVAVVALGALIMPALSDQPSPGQSKVFRDTRAAVPPQNLDTPRSFPHYATLEDWERRRSDIRRQILVSCGLDPLPPKTPLKPHVFGKVERDGYTIEKVAIQTYPGFYLCGNLYRPHGASAGSVRHPGVLVAHGHWANGRMADQEFGSIPARAITFAREGIVAFTYDMVGYNDTRQIPHTYAGDRNHWVWGVSLLGLQTWNSIRALDFLISLPDVDRSKLAITGESGGGTQTMLLGAIDDRLAAVGPCVMVSHAMQGGCLCENAPGLRVDFSNMEVAACAAPKPQIMVGATGDWTKTMMTIEGPGVESIYKLYGKPENLKYCIFDYGHNINKTSREAVYQAFGKWLLDLPDADTLREPPYKMEAVEDLRVFPDATGMPKDAIDADELTAHLKKLAIDQLERSKPHDAASLAAFKKEFMPIWQQTLGLELPAEGSIFGDEMLGPIRGNSEEIFTIHRTNRNDSIPAKLFTPEKEKPISTVVLAAPKGINEYMSGADRPGPLVTALLHAGNAVLLLDCFLTGSAADPAVEKAREQPFGVFFDTYNRTNLQERVQDLVTAIAFVRMRLGGPVVLSGRGSAGLWALLASPDADGVSADVNHFDMTTDAGYVTDYMYAPCLRHFGDFKTSAVLAAPHPLALFNVDEKFTAAGWIRDVYQKLGVQDRFTTTAGPMSDDDVLAVALGVRKRGGQ